MAQTNIRIDPLTTNCVLKKLGLAIEEIKLMRPIDSVLEQVDKTQAGKLGASRRRYLESELKFLNKRLETLRKEADLKQA